MTQPRAGINAFLWVGLCILAFSAHAQSQQPMVRTLSVVGEASAQLSPDQAVVTVGLISKNKLLAEAKQQNDAMVSKFLAVTREFKVEERDIATSQLSVNPEYHYPNDGSSPKLTGFNVQRTLTVTLKKLDTYEKFIAKLVDAGVDQLQGVQFTISQPEARLDTLRLEAFASAEQKAEALAKKAGLTLGKPLSIRTEGAQPPPMPMPYMARAMMAESAPVPPPLAGQQSLSQRVEVVFEVE